PSRCRMADRNVCPTSLTRGDAGVLGGFSPPSRVVAQVFVAFTPFVPDVIGLGWREVSQLWTRRGAGDVGMFGMQVGLVAVVVRRDEGAIERDARERGLDLRRDAHAAEGGGDRPERVGRGEAAGAGVERLGRVEQRVRFAPAAVE